MAQALYRKWRPQSFDDVVGQDHVTTTLKNQIATRRIGHAYLFVGSRGCGKTTTARILAKEINLRDLNPDDSHVRQQAAAIAEGRALDVIEFDAATHTKVEEMREVLEKVVFQPSELRYKVYIIDEVHMLSLSAFNALLKTLEEPPPHVVFILATTDPQKIPATVLSRCQRFNFKRVPVRVMVDRLHRLCDAEGIEADDHALTLIARHATGSLRDAISLLDQLASSSSMRISADDVREALGATDAATVRAVMGGLARRDAAAGLDAIQAAIDQGADARQIARQMIDTLRAALQTKLGHADGPTGELSDAERQELADFAGQVSPTALLRGIRAFSAAINDMRNSVDTQLSLEMAFLECVTAGDDARTDARTDAAPDRPARAEPAGLQPHAPAPVAPVDGAHSATPWSPSARVVPAPARSGAEAGEAGEAQVEVEAERASVKPGASADRFGEATAETLRGLWKQLIQDVNSGNKAAAALLRSCHPHAVVGDLVRFQADHELIRQRLDDPKNKASVTAALNKLLSGKYTIQVFTGQPPEPDPNDDPVVKVAQRLGGKVRD